VETTNFLAIKHVRQRFPTFYVCEAKEQTVTRDPTMETSIASDIHYKWINTNAFFLTQQY